MRTLTFLFVLTLAATTGLESLAAQSVPELERSCQASRKDTSFKELERTLAFDEARAHCDAAKPAKLSQDCRAAARYWIAVREFVAGHYPRAEQNFREAAEISARIGKPTGWKGGPGWGATEDMLRYATRRKELGAIEPEYTQKLVLVFASAVDATIKDKPVRGTLDPCSVLHARLSFGLTSRYMETFSKGRFSIEVRHEILPVTVSKLSSGVIVENSMRPWGADMAARMHRIVTENDAIFYVYPKGGGVANAGSGTVPIVPDLLSSPRRAIGRLPTGWGTVKNLAQSFHEYLHTVEAMTGFRMTSHGGSQGDKLRALTGVNGESNWADWMFGNKIRAKADALAAKKKRSGYLILFGRSSAKPGHTEEAAREGGRLFETEGADGIQKRRESAAESLEVAEKLWKSGRRSEAAEMAFTAATTYPLTKKHLVRARQMVEKGGLDSERRDRHLKRLDELQRRFFG